MSVKPTKYDRGYNDGYRAAVAEQRVPSSGSHIGDAGRMGRMTMKPSEAIGRLQMLDTFERGPFKEAIQYAVSAINEAHGLRRVFGHYYVQRTADSSRTDCGQCGLDLRHPIHLREQP